MTSILRRQAGRARSWLQLYCHDRGYRRWHRENVQNIRAFRNVHEGQDCFIVGNGPSLNKMDLTLLNDYYSFGLNKIYLMFDRVDFRPSFHVAVNPLVIQQGAREIAELSCPVFLSFSAADGVVPVHPHITRLYTGGSVGFSGSIEQQIWEGYTVTFVAMQVAYYMGFRNVFLVGVDHNFRASGAPNEQQLLVGPDPNHFDPNYFGGQQWHLPDLEGSELAYHMAKFVFERSGREIVDATVGGKCDIFRKCSYSDALRSAKRKGS